MQTFKQVIEKNTAADILAESCKESSFSINFEDKPQTGNNVLHFNSTRSV